LLWDIIGLSYRTKPVTLSYEGCDKIEFSIARRTSLKHMEALEEETNLERLLEASYDGDVAAVRALLESGAVAVNGIANKVRLIKFCSCAKPQVALLRRRPGRVGGVDVACDCGLMNVFTTHE
jgi:hypothetical protein